MTILSISHLRKGDVSLLLDHYFTGLALVFILPDLKVPVLLLHSQAQEVEEVLMSAKTHTLSRLYSIELCNSYVSFVLYQVISYYVKVYAV